MSRVKTAAMTLVWSYVFVTTLYALARICDDLIWHFKNRKKES